MSYLQINKENEFTLLRAAEISAYINSQGPTIGPNSTVLDLQCSFDDLSITTNGTKEGSIENDKPVQKSNRRSTGSRLDVNDIKYIHDKMHQENEKRRINVKTLR